MESYNGMLCTKTDALYLIQAARKRLVPLITQRFSSYERQTCIRPGTVFVWSETGSNIKRWTDGRKWSASRVSGVFLSYREMKPALSAAATCHIVDTKDHGLLKQSFSYCVGSEKYHVVSYVTGDFAAGDASAAAAEPRYQRPSLDARFRDLRLEELLEEVSEARQQTPPPTPSPSPSRKRPLAGCPECVDAGPAAKRATPPSPPLHYTHTQPHPRVVLPPLHSILHLTGTAPSSSSAGQSSSFNTAAFDRQTLLALRCSFS